VIGALVLVDGPDGPTVREVGAGIPALSGRPADELIGRRWPPLWAPSATSDALLAALRAGRPARAEVELDGPAEARRSAEVLVEPLLEPDAPAVICVVRVLEHYDAGDELTWLVDHDPLTGLANRRLLRRDLEKAMSRATREGGTVAVLYLDLDEFKAINDTYGHAGGDAVLRAVAERLQATVRAHDTVARVGGDEFVIVLAGLPPGEAAAQRADAVAAHVRSALLAPVEIETTTVTVSASVGVGVLAEGARSGAQLLADADRAMYRTKRAGRRSSEAADRLVARARAAERRAHELKRQATGAIDAATTSRRDSPRAGEPAPRFM